MNLMKILRTCLYSLLLCSIAFGSDNDAINAFEEFAKNIKNKSFQEGSEYSILTACSGISRSFDEINGRIFVIRNRIVEPRNNGLNYLKHETDYRDYSWEVPTRIGLIYVPRTCANISKNLIISHGTDDNTFSVFLTYGQHVPYITSVVAIYPFDEQGNKLSTVDDQKKAEPSESLYKRPIYATLSSSFP